MAKKSQRLRRQRRIERIREMENQTVSLKAVEDNSVILERMKVLTSSIDQIIHSIEPEVEPIVAEPESVIEAPVMMKAEPSVEMRIQPHDEPTLIKAEVPNLNKMTKRALLKYARSNNITVKSSMSKTQLIKTIQES